MITTNKDYMENLHIIQNQNPPSLALLPKAEKVYKIDLATRQVESPKFLSVSKDHVSETIYFEVDRYADYMDLSHTTCIVQYINAAGEARIYPVPFFDTTTKANERKMLLPWCIDAGVARKKGTVEFSFRFYLVDEQGEYFLYNLNTSPAKSEVLEGMEVQELTDDYNLSSSQFDTIMQEIAKLNRPCLCWTELIEPTEIKSGD